MAIEILILEKYRLGNFVAACGILGLKAGVVHRMLTEWNTDLGTILDKAGSLKYVSDRISNAKGGRGVKPAEMTKKDTSSVESFAKKCEAMIVAEKAAIKEQRAAEKAAAAKASKKADKSKK